MMKKYNNIKPTSLKGNDQINRMRSLMGMAPINENTKTSVVELTKKGPDGKVYGIVRENHKYFIKTTDKQNNLVAEDFSYVGGLQNKTKKAYDSYSQAAKQLNLKFISLNEALGVTKPINILKNDNLLAETYESYSEAPKGSQPDTTLGNVKSMGQNDGHDDEIMNEGLDEGSFNEWCESQGFDEGAGISCAREALSVANKNDDDELKKKVIFYMNTVKPEGHDFDYISEADDKDEKDRDRQRYNKSQPWETNQSDDKDKKDRDRERHNKSQSWERTNEADDKDKKDKDREMQNWSQNWENTGYQKLFHDEMKRMGYDPNDFSEMSDNEKRNLFNRLDKKWTSKEEAKNESVELTETERAIDNIIRELRGDVIKESTTKLKITTAINNIKKGEDSSKKKA